MFFYHREGVVMTSYCIFAAVVVPLSKNCVKLRCEEFMNQEAYLARPRPSLRACTHASRATRLATAPGAIPQGCPKVPPPNCST
ncbi:hypothetical protein OSB04_007038 [Centaurea solstitialis]|uniref:Uncharacterized protein n=1 Tax=Centaurea solstitialis TaxID=347529 RepID=A0AA38U3N8_9ASTR|nr:hypothetical protein OSB04_007038 [Centaurea solstitialis]